MAGVHEGLAVWVRFTADYDYRQPGFTIAYKAGMECNVTQRCATLAVLAGAAVRLRKANKTEEPTEWPSEVGQALSTPR